MEKTERDQLFKEILLRQRQQNLRIAFVAPPKTEGKSYASLMVGKYLQKRAARNQELIRFVGEICSGLTNIIFAKWVVPSGISHVAFLVLVIIMFTFAGIRLAWRIL